MKKIEAGMILFLLLSLSVAEDVLMPGELWESGYIPVRGEENELFYFLVRSRDKNPEAPLIVWMNGGPGCSSVYGLFHELGPVIVDPEKLVFKKNEYSWNNHNDMLFVDQPVEVGFSTVKDDAHVCINQTCVANDFYTFLTKFLEKYPRYERRPLYMSGESYGGHYIPSIAARVVRNKNPLLNLQGIAVGNPFTSMEVQLGPYSYFLYYNKNITFFEYLQGKAATFLCQMGFKLHFEKANLTHLCEFSLGGIMKLPNPYDIRKKKDYSDMDKVLLEKLNDKAIIKLIGSKKAKVEFCNDTIYDMFEVDLATSVAPDIEYLLGEKKDVMLYFGDKDYMCNWMGGEDLVNSLEWYGRSDFLKAKVVDFKVDGISSGKYRKFGHLNYMIIYDAGHMVPMDQNKASLRMLDSFLARNFTQ